MSLQKCTYPHTCMSAILDFMMAQLSFSFEWPSSDDCCKKEKGFFQRIFDWKNGAILIMWFMFSQWLTKLVLLRRRIPCLMSSSKYTSLSFHIPEYRTLCKSDENKTWLFACESSTYFDVFDSLDSCMVNGSGPLGYIFFCLCAVQSTRLLPDYVLHEHTTGDDVTLSTARREDKWVCSLFWDCVWL